MIAKIGGRLFDHQFVARFVRGEPFTVVIGLELAQEGDRIWWKAEVRGG